MDDSAVFAQGECPPHYWLIGRNDTEHGAIERWACQRCPETRDRTLAGTRRLRVAPRRLVGISEESPIAFIGRGGERVA